MANEFQASVAEGANQEMSLKASDSSQTLATPADAKAKIVIVPPHIPDTTSTTVGRSSMVSIVSSRTVSLGSGVTASSSAVPVTSGSAAGSILAIVFIVIIILSVISCVAGCIWRCCIQKGRKERAAQSDQQTAQEYPQDFPQGRSQHYHYRSDMPEEQIYRQTQNEIAVHDMNIDSPLRPRKLNVTRRFETIPEHEDTQEDSIAEQRSANNPDLQNSNISPRKGYFYHPDAASERS